MFANPNNVKAGTARPDWHQDVIKYQQPDLGKAIWQLVNTFIPYAIL